MNKSDINTYPPSFFLPASKFLLLRYNISVYKKSSQKLILRALCYQIIFSAVRTGLEPVTPCVTGMYSNQLN